MKKICLLLAVSFLLVFSGCNKDLAGKWQMNLDLKVNQASSSEVLRLEPFPLNVILEQDGDTVYVLPPSYISGGFSGKGYLKDNKFYFTMTAFDGFLFQEKIKVETIDLAFDCSGDISPEGDYISGDVISGNLVLINEKGENISCSVKEGFLRMVKKGIKK